MTRIRTIVKVSAFALAASMLVPLDASAQSLTRAGMRARPAVITQEDILDAAARAEGYAQSGQFAEARREYRAAASLQYRVGELPVNAHWQIAQAYYAEGDLRRAAESLDELATAAAARNRPDVRAEALLEAAFLYRAAGATQRAREIAKELRTLAKSDAIGDELRAEIEQRMR